MGSMKNRMMMMMMMKKKRHWYSVVSRNHSRVDAICVANLDTKLWIVPQNTKRIMVEMAVIRVVCWKSKNDLILSCFMSGISKLFLRVLYFTGESGYRFR